MLIKLLYDLVEEIAGAETGAIVEILFGKKNVNEFLIAKKLNLTVNQVRNILYKLSAEGMVSFTRKKDKRKGWYIYYWTLDPQKSLEKLKETLQRRIAQLENNLRNRETKRYYVCKFCNIEVGEEKALENDFMCEGCGEVYELSDNEEHIAQIKKDIKKTEKHLELIDAELEKMRLKAERKKAREQRKKEKEKEEKRAAQKAAREAKKKALKKTAKKTQTKSKKQPARKTKTTSKKTQKKTAKKTSRLGRLIKKQASKLKKAITKK